MAWGTWAMGTQTTIAVGTFPQNVFVPSAIGVCISGIAFDYPVDLQIIFNQPWLAGKLEIDATNHLAAAGSSPQFPVTPKWRKVVRTIG